MIEIARYAPGGDIWEELNRRHGPDAANRVWGAAQTGDRFAISRELAALRFGAFENESTASLFVSQITTNPLAAPLESANRQIGNVFKNIFANPWVLIVLLSAAAFYLWPVISAILKRR